MNVEKTAFGGWENCYHLYNDHMDVIVTTDVGPRVIYFGLRNGTNMFHTVPEHLGKTGGDEWRAYGGHRLWHAPEVRPRTYQPDNVPVDHFDLDNIHYFVPPIEEATGIQKQISMSFKNDDTLVVDHTFTNTGMWPIELAPWALTVMRPGGVGILPLPPHVGHDVQLLPTHAVTLWGYSSLNDPRLQFGDKYIMMYQRPNVSAPLKIGLQVTQDYLWSVGWLAYVNQGTMFVKSFHPPLSAMRYPDMGSQVELFTDDTMMELETLGGLRQLPPDETVTHREYWSLHANVADPQDDAQIGQDILPLVREAHPNVGRRKTGPLRSMD
ncbi:MAG: hypothetical protein ACFE0Q_19335 [Anaerolineae bacterium]